MSRDGASPDATRVWVSMNAGGRGLVCVSGLGGETDKWMNVGPALARHGDVIAVALTLDAPNSRHGGGGRLQIAVRALDRLLAGEPERPVLVGHSMGALASMLVAATRSDRVAGLVLTAPFVPAARNGRSSLVTAPDYGRHRVLFLMGTRRRRRERRGPRPLSRRLRGAGLGALARYGLRPGAFHAVADRVTCPVLLVHGGDDHYVPPPFVLAAAARHPSWQVALLAGAGHFPHRDDPTAWLATVDPWLQGLQPR